MFILKNKDRFFFDQATGYGSDSSIDPTASSVNPNAYLASDVGFNGLRGILVIAVLVLLILYIFKKL